MEGLSTIHFYIILKRFLFSLLTTSCLSTIHFYIILKQAANWDSDGICLSTIHFYIILKPCVQPYPIRSGLSTIHFYIILKPREARGWLLYRLSTIHFYIILKLCLVWRERSTGLSTIHFYIILKLSPIFCRTNGRLSTIHFYIILKPMYGYATHRIVWVPYIFTSFSNLKFKNELLSSAQNRYSNIRWILIDITSIFVNYIIFSLIRKVPLYIFYEKQGYFIVACHLGEFVYLCFVQIGSNID